MQFIVYCRIHLLLFQSVIATCIVTYGAALGCSLLGFQPVLFKVIFEYLFK